MMDALLAENVHDTTHDTTPGIWRGYHNEANPDEWTHVHWHTVSGKRGSIGIRGVERIGAQTVAPQMRFGFEEA